MTLNATRIERKRLQGGTSLETLVDVVAIVALLVGILMAVGFLLTFYIWGVLAGISSAIGGFVSWLLFRCLAEHLRLLKKIAGMEIAGSITGMQEETVWSCSNCGQMLHSEHRCDSCGAQIAD